MATNKYTSEFNVSCKGEVTGEMFIGKFTVKTRLSHFDQLKRDEARRSLLGPSPVGQKPNEQAMITAEVFSQLAIRIVQAPSWWTDSNNGIDMMDSDPVTKVYETTMTAVKEEEDRLKAEAKKAEEELRGPLAAPATP
jgi:hypothetical protein